jgi:hypothetical protein
VDLISEMGGVDAIVKYDYNDCGTFAFDTNYLNAWYIGNG